MIFQRSYDETGRICRTQAVMPDGQLVTSSETAKMVSGKVPFAGVLEQAGVLHVIQGALPTLIANGQPDGSGGRPVP